MTDPDAFADTFAEHYAIALLWANTYVEPIAPDDTPENADPAWWDGPAWDSHLTAFGPEDVLKIREDTDAFVLSCWDDLKGLDPAQCGHDFLLTRSGHGAGFWDRGLGEVGERLTAASKPYGDTYAWCHRDDDPASDNLAHLEY